VPAGTSVPGRCLLHLQASNLQGMEALHLRRLLCPSGAWSLANLEQAAEVDQQQATQDAQLGMDLQLGPEAAAACYYHLRPAAEGAGGTLPAAASSLSEAERYFQRSAASVPATVPCSRGPALELSGSVDLVVQWEAAGKAAGGERILGYSSVSIPSVQLGPPVHAQLLGPGGGSVVHDFSAAPICTLPLRLRLRNELFAPASVVIEAGRQVTAAGEARTPGGSDSALCFLLGARGLESGQSPPPFAFRVQFWPRGPPPVRPPPLEIPPPSAAAHCQRWAARRHLCASTSGPAAPASPCPACRAGVLWRFQCTCRRRRRGSLQ